MAKKITGYVKLQVPAGKANPSPPIGPALGQRGLNIMEFCKAFNAKTQGLEPGLPIPVVITAFADKSFTFIMKTPPATVLIKKASGVQKGSAKPHTDKVGLDWEMATLGDPLMDLGSALAYWVEESDSALFKATRRQPTNLKGMFTRKEVVDYYLEKTGLEVENWTFYEVFGIFRLAVIAQQIYYRYHHKQTNNPAFKDFWILIHALHIRALKLIGLQKIEANEVAQKYIVKMKEILGK